MVKIERSWEMLSEQNKKECISGLIDFFAEEIETDQKIGVISAEKILNYFLQTTGVQLYNKGVEDSITFLDQRFEDTKFDMHTLVKR